MLKLLKGEDQTIKSLQYIPAIIQQFSFGATAALWFMLQLQLLYIHNSSAIPYTQCPLVSRVTASDQPLNDSVGCPSSLLKLLTVLGFIIDETLSAGYSNMQDLQTSVRMNTLLSRCLYRHLPLS